MADVSIIEELKDLRRKALRDHKHRYTAGLIQKAIAALRDFDAALFLMQGRAICLSAANDKLSNELAAMSNKATEATFALNASLAREKKLQAMVNAMTAAEKSREWEVRSLSLEVIDLQKYKAAFIQGGKV